MSPLKAQTDVTDQYIVNADMEANVESGKNLPEECGWSKDGTVTNFWGLTVNAAWTGMSGLAIESWSPNGDAPLSRKMYQVIESVPNGFYRLSVAAFANYQKANAGTATTGVTIYANEYSVPVDIHYDQSISKVYEFEFQVTDGTLEIGMNLDNAYANWVAFDNFKLYAFTGEAGLIKFYEDKLKTLAEEADVLVTELPTGETETFISEKARIMADAEGATTSAQLQALVAEMTALMESVSSLHELYLSLFDLLNVTYDEMKELNYPGLGALEDALNDAMDVAYSETALKADFEKAIADFNTAILTYRKSNFENGTLDNPIDATFLVKNPEMNSAGANWTFDTFGSITSGDSYPPFAGTFLEKWIAGPGVLVDCGAYQIITDLPTGIYKFTAAVNAVQQNDVSTPVTGVYLYANAGNVSVSTGNGVPEVFSVFGAVLDGTLKIGLKTVSTTANWVGFDNAVLEYCGKDLSTYEEAYQVLAEEAVALSEGQLLPKDKKTIDDAVVAAQAAPRTTVAEVEAVMNTLQLVVDEVATLQKATKAFFAGSYAKTLAIAEDAEDIYDSSISELMADVLNTQDLTLNNDTTSISVFPVLKADLDVYLFFASLYQDLYVHGENLAEPDLKAIITQVLSERCAAVSASIDACESGRLILYATRSFCDAYESTITYALEAEEDDIMTVATAQLAIAKADPAQVAAAEREMAIIVAAKRFAGEEPGEGTDMTWLIVNPGSDGPDNNTIPEGWWAEKFNGNTYTNKDQHWSADKENRYIDSWHGTEGGLKHIAAQKLRGIPNGLYKIVAAARASGEGSYLFGMSNGKVQYTEIPKTGDVGGSIWENAEEGSAEKTVNSSKGRGWNWVEVIDARVEDNSLIIGCTTNQSITGAKAWTGNWFSVDDFSVFWTGILTGVEEVDADNADAELIAYVENGYIVVPGVESFTMTTIDGIPVSAGTQLIPGTYIVQAGDKVVKVFVK